MSAQPTSEDVVATPRATRNTSNSPDYSILNREEVVWRDLQPWLEERGYMLRPRYRVGWVPKWKGTKILSLDHEDAHRIARPQLLDATRITTGEIVMLKRISKRQHPTEVEITRYFSTEPIASHPRNHSIPLYEILNVPGDDDNVILVLPFLRPYDSPTMESVGEAVEFFRQIFEGLHFIHQSHIAHRDCMNLNIMMDPRNMFPKMFHPASNNMSLDWKGSAKYYSRTQRPTKYYIIDFGLSDKFNPEDGPPSAWPIESGDRTVPEFRNKAAWKNHDPFPTDVYYLGNLIREDFFQRFRGVEFMRPLVDDMVQDDPAKRPNMDEVVERFDKIRASLGWWTLRKRLVPLEDEFPIPATIRHLFRTAIDILAFRSALPTPKA